MRVGSIQQVSQISLYCLYCIVMNSNIKLQNLFDLYFSPRICYQSIESVNRINWPPQDTPQQSPINQLAFPDYSSISKIKSNQTLFRLHVCCPPTFPFFNLVSVRILPTVILQPRYEELSALRRSNLFDRYEEGKPDEKPICEPVFRERGQSGAINQKPIDFHKGPRLSPFIMKGCNG